MRERFATIRTALDRHHRIAVFIFFAILFVVGLFVTPHFGLSWDEDVSRHQGWVNFEYITKDNPRLLTDAERNHGPAFETILYAVEEYGHISDISNVYLMRHYLTFCLVFVSLVAFYWIAARHFKSWKMGLLGVTLLVLSPRLAGHGIYNDKDMGFFAAFVIAQLLLLLFLDRPRWYTASLFGLAAGFAISIRIMAVLLPVYLLLLWIPKIIVQRDALKSKIRQAGAVLLGLLITVSSTILFFPTLWPAPYKNFVLALEEMAHYHWDGLVLYMGELVRATQLPWHYAPLWILLTTPVVTTLLAICGLVVVARHLLRQRLSAFRDQHTLHEMLFALWVLVPLLSIIILRSVIYDDWRHLYYTAPGMILLALTGLAAIQHRIAAKKNAVLRKRLSMAGVAILATSLLYSVYFAVCNFPYWNLYFNPAAQLVYGGLENLAQNYEMDYWGLSAREALEYLLKNDHSEKIAIYVPSDSYPVKLNADILPQADRERLSFVGQNDAHYVVQLRRAHPGSFTDPREIYAVQVGQATILSVRTLR